MRKVMTIFALMFLVLGIMLHSPLVFAESNDSNSDDANTSAKANITSSANSGEGSDDEKETEDEDEKEDKKGSESNLVGESRRTKKESKDVVIDDNGCKIKIERKIEIEKGKRVEVIKKKMECPDGRKAEVQFKRENRTVNGVTKERIKYEVEGEDSVEVELEDEMEVEEEVNGTEYGLKAKLRNGNLTDIKIMPDRASAIAIERLRALNFTVELRAVGQGNSSRAVYYIETNKTGRFLGIFKMKVREHGQIDPTTGEYLGTGKPWWAFLVAGEDSDQTEDTTENSSAGTIFENSTGALNGTGAAQ